MQVQSVCFSHPIPKFPSKSSNPIVSSLLCNPQIHSISQSNPRVSLISLSIQLTRSSLFSKGRLVLARTSKTISYLPNSEDAENSDILEDKEEVVSAPTSNSGKYVSQPGGDSGWIGLDPFRGKPGSVSFCGLNHQIIEGRKLVSSPFKDDKGSFVWVVGPVVLIASLLLPSFFIGNAMEAVVEDVILAEIVTSFFSEIIFYAGLAIFLFTTNHVQRPYLDFSPKRWSLITTGLRGYLSSSFFTMGFKIFAPIFAAYAVWPIIGLPAAIAVAPFLFGCASQFLFETYLNFRNMSCWPLLPIIFELYRLYQLNKGAHFLESLMFSKRGAMKGSSMITPEMLEQSGAVFSMLTVLLVLGVVCLWSLATFLLRLFPSRPVSENY